MRYAFRYYKGVKYVAPNRPAPETYARCGHCKRAWDDSRATSLTPAPSGRCPFEYWHNHKSAAPPSHMTISEVVALTPKLSQRQDSTMDQLQDLIAVANKLGCYDAADWMRQTVQEAARKGGRVGPTF